MAWGNAGSPVFSERIRGPFRRQHQDASHNELNVRLEERFRERTRIARELHDTLLQGLLGASMQLQLVDEHLLADSPVKPSLSRAVDLLARAIAEGRAVLQGLRSRQNVTTSLERSLADLKEEFLPADGARLRISAMGQPTDLDANVQEQVYLITREALFNALLHAQARDVEAEIEYSPSKLRVVVRDNGTGIDPRVLQGSRTSHWGMTGMHERAANIGAQLRVWSKTGVGTEVELSLPLDVS